jgi:hypothetical protein
MRCPECWSQDTDRACASCWLDRLAACLLLATCRCRHCLAKFHVFSWQVGAPQAAASVASWKTPTAQPNQRRAA